MERTMILILLLAVFGIIYSLYLSVYIGDLYVGFIMVLITLGISSTIYILGKRVNYRIIFYIWIAIIVIAVVVLMFQWTYNFFEGFRI
jgi:hypothetical protein